MIPFEYNTINILIIVLAAGLSTLLDIDLQWQRQGYPFHHRGRTHSILAALIAGVLFGIFMWYGFKEILYFGIGFIAGFMAVVSHMLGDLLTHMAFKPLWPFDKREVSFGICSASNRAANEGLGTVGTLAFFVYILNGQGSLSVFIDAIKSLFRILE
jgi:membrane-bound metal-dependent hydrolase YbcI (DUF457 family)